MKSEILEGGVRQKSADELKSWLQQEKEGGNRFVSFPAEIKDLTRDDFTAFKTAFSAQEHAYENTTDRDRYIIRSIAVVEKELARLQEQAKEQQQGKATEKEQGEKRSRGQELSC